MRIARYSLLCGAILCLASFIAPRDNLLSEVKEKVRKNSDSAPIVIHSDTLEVDQQKRVIVFEGKVKAKQEELEKAQVDVVEVLAEFPVCPTCNRPMGEGHDHTTLED